LTPLHSKSYRVKLPSYKPKRVSYDAKVVNGSKSLFVIAQLYSDWSEWKQNNFSSSFPYKSLSCGTCDAEKVGAGECQAWMCYFDDNNTDFAYYTALNNDPLSNMSVRLYLSTDQVVDAASSANLITRDGFTSWLALMLFCMYFVF